MLAGVPYAPISPAYSLVSQDFGKLRHILDLLTPGLVFAQRRRRTRKAIARGRAGATRRWCSPTARLDGRDDAPVRRPARDACRPRPSMPRTPQVGPDTIAKFLFTSGSTKLPKGVINTQRMLCATSR